MFASRTRHKSIFFQRGGKGGGDGRSTSIMSILAFTVIIMSFDLLSSLDMIELDRKDLSLEFETSQNAKIVQLTLRYTIKLHTCDLNTKSKYRMFIC